MAGKAERLDNTSLEMRKGRAASKESCVGGRGGGHWQSGQEEREKNLPDG